ncbi:MAG TPA: hypothetical protein VF937_10835 [Chloroflexota bacterium]
MSVSVAAPARVPAQLTVRLPGIYAVSLAFWLVTRWLVLVHQGAWPWMNAFVVAAARGIVVGDWNDAVRPQLPAVLGVPLVLVGASEQQVVAALYVLASVVQFAAFIVLLRAVFPGRLEEQTLGLLVFLLVPFNHSIHHYRDMPVVLASAAIFLLSADFVHACRSAPRMSLGRAAGLCAVMLLGVWSRIEILAFVAVLALVAVVVWRSRALRLAITYVVAAAVVTGSLLVVYRLEDVDLSQAWFYTAHTFLDSTPDSWLTPACRADPTENCREADGLTYFGPADLHAGVLALALNHPLTTIAKSVRSAWDNLWVLFGPNLSTFPGVIPFVVLALGLSKSVRGVYRQVPGAAWIVAAAVLAESVLPPLTWAPPHPQYHVALVLPVALMLVPVLLALVRMPRGRWIAVGFLIANAGMSAFRYTRYPGY